ncbi:MULTISPECIES: efflux RND transporter periplasmic adaptor subunit [Methylosinus]|uniref:Efflux RND transporter periplasmic adaptor subunit n=1 Tax=Methylosinus trichosporium (strain ATCC 35070 / NCIMB 11131 / UNIQEM 75 / OB3b) TaxID=595536 RepID=A0A2D2CYT4_METT3|nr:MULTISPECIES: efflux RND transporter periplasmic adaptor subunit [Methylosinus]ATQ67898.1 efflux RND transporter periplasmic adaptor subunit [Methylosinus trichosporium OB3b]
MRIDHADETEADERAIFREPDVAAASSGEGLHGGAWRKPSAFGVAALVVALGCYVGYRAIAAKEQPTQRAGQRAASGGPQPVAVATATRGDIKIVRHGLLGTVTPIANVSVKTRLAGELTEVGFTEGQYVRKGDFLAQIDPRPYEAQKAQSEGQLLRDQALLGQARDDLRRYESLKKLDSIARQQAENQAWIVKQYEGAVKADAALVDGQNLNLTYARILSPVAGRVGLRKVDAGSYVSAGDALVLVAQIDPISVIFGVPEDYIPDILSAQKKGALEVAAFDRADTKQLAVGRLRTLDNTVDTTTGMVSGRAEFENTNEALYPNQFVNIHLLVELREKALVIPKTAIRSGASSLFVYKVTEENRVVMQRILPASGERYDDYAGYNNGMVEVTEGLSEGDRVVVDGADRLREGAEVKIGTADEPARERRRQKRPRQSETQ